MQLKMRYLHFNSSALREARGRIIDETARKGVQIFRQEIRRRRLINTGHMLDSVGATIKRNSVTFDINADYAGIINDGVRRHKMRYLVDAGPIPLVTRRGRKIFRVATPSNIRERDRWLHPGFKRGKGFFDKSADKIEAVAKELIIDEGII